MIKPRILIIDDQLAAQIDLRQEFCERCDLIDIHAAIDDFATRTDPDDFIAEAVFCSGQILSGDEKLNSIESVLEIVDTGWKQSSDNRWALILLDVRFDSKPARSSDETFGFTILETLVKQWPDMNAGEGNCDIPIVMLSALRRSERGREAGRAGASKYVEKSELDRLQLAELLDRYGLIPDDSGLIIGRSVSLLKTLRLARSVGRNGQGNVLILGETGSGKTLLAEYIHKHSPRRNHEFHAFFVSEGRDPTVLKGDLYGYWQGAFTNAEKSEAGKSERAHLSTLFIDEIGNLPASGQAELLEYGRLDKNGTRSFDRLGTFPTSPEKLVVAARCSLIGEYNKTTQKISVDVFLITATNAPIDDSEYRTKKGFRDDLFFRLGKEYHPFISFPPLASRLDDLQTLFEHFLKEETLKNAGRWPKYIVPEVTHFLRAHTWPGNVGELKGVVNFVEKMSRDWEEVLPRHLPRELTVKEPPRDTGEPAPVPQSATILENGRHLIQLLETMRMFESPKSRQLLTGSLLSLQGEYGKVIQKLLETALEETKTIHGDYVPTTAINLLVGQTLRAPEAASLLLRISKYLSIDPDEGSGLWHALEWSMRRRR